MVATRRATSRRPQDAVDVKPAIPGPARNIVPIQLAQPSAGPAQPPSRKRKSTDVFGVVDDVSSASQSRPAKRVAPIAQNKGKGRVVQIPAATPSGSSTAVPVPAPSRSSGAAQTTKDNASSIVDQMSQQFDRKIEAFARRIPALMTSTEAPISNTEIRNAIQAHTAFAQTTSRQVAALHPLFASLRGDMENHRVLLHSQMTRSADKSLAYIQQLVDDRYQNLQYTLNDIDQTVDSIQEDTNQIPGIESMVDDINRCQDDVAYDIRHIQAETNKMSQVVYVIRGTEETLGNMQEGTNRLDDIDHTQDQLVVTVNETENRVDELLKRNKRLKMNLAQRHEALETTNRRLTRMEQGMARMESHMARWYSQQASTCVLRLSSSGSVIATPVAVGSAGVRDLPNLSRQAIQSSSGTRQAALGVMEGSANVERSPVVVDTHCRSKSRSVRPTNVVKKEPALRGKKTASTTAASAKRGKK